MVVVRRAFNSSSGVAVISTSEPGFGTVVTYKNAKRRGMMTITIICTIREECGKYKEEDGKDDMQLSSLAQGCPKFSECEG